MLDVPCGTLELFDCRMTAGQQLTAYAAIAIVVSIVLLVGVRALWRARHDGKQDAE